MSEFLSGWAASSFQILFESAPYLLVGFVLAGVIRVLLPEDKVRKHLGGDDFRSVALAALFGAPMPLCSCSALPAAMALRRSGASKGATTSFLISTPETDVEAISLTWALMDPIMTVARPLGGLCTALGAGSLVNLLVRKRLDNSDDSPGAAAVAPACDAGPAARAADLPHDHGHEHEHGHDHDHAHGPERPAARRSALRVLAEALRYAFGPLLADLTPWLLLGFALSGLITSIVPADFFGGVVPDGWPAMLLMLVVGIPLYICAAASTPVAAALIAKGLDPGAALVLLLAGPAVSVASLPVVSQLLGRRVMLAYLSSIAAGALAFGFGVDAIYGLLDRAPGTAVAAESGTEYGFGSYLAGAVVLGLLAWHARRAHLATATFRRVRATALPLGFDLDRPLARGALVLAAFLAWAATAFTVVQPGDTVFLLRFGRIAAVYREPGLYRHAPFPIDTVEVVKSGRVRAVAIGTEGDAIPPVDAFSDEGPARGLDRLDETEVTTGDEYVVSVSWTVQYRYVDAFRARFAFAEPERLLRSLAEAALRRAAATRTADEVTLSARATLHTEIARLLQEELDALDSGIEIEAVDIIYAHAPAQVHYAFRDLASALEDKERNVRMAEGYTKETLANARAAAHRSEQQAVADAARTLGRARGDAAGFASVLETFALDPVVTRVRRAAEAVEAALARVKVVALLGSGVDVRLLPGGNPAAAGSPLPEAKRVPAASAGDEDG